MAIKTVYTIQEQMKKGKIKITINSKKIKNVIVATVLPSVFHLNCEGD